MSKVIAIAIREFHAMVATKAFLMTLVMMPVLMLGGIVLIPTLTKLGGIKERKIIVIDGTDHCFHLIDSASKERNQIVRQASAENNESDDIKEMVKGINEIWTFENWNEREIDDATRLELSKRIRDGNLYAFVEIPSSIGSSNAPHDSTRFVCQDAMLSGARMWMESLLREDIRTRRLSELDIDPQLVAEANVPIDFVPTLPYSEGEGGELDRSEGVSAMVSMMLPFGIMMLMFMVIFLAAQPMLESGMEERNQRIAELLLGSVNPTQLMAGKLIGNVAGSFVVFAVYGGGGWIALQQYAWSSHLPWSLMPWLIVFQILGVLFYSSIFLTIGASVSELKEAQSLLLPVWLFMMLPVMSWFVAVRDPNGVLASSLSFFPPSAPLMMALRMSSGQSMPIWSAPVAALIMLAATALVLKIAGRIYRASLLKSDSAKSITQFYRRLKAAE